MTDPKTNGLFKTITSDPAVQSAGASLLVAALVAGVKAAIFKA
jgi:hypothetical protein